MAYAGVTLALIQPFNEYADYRRAAVLRMLDMNDADKAGIKKGQKARFSASERGFVDAIAALVSQNPESARDRLLSFYFPCFILRFLLNVCMHHYKNVKIPPQREIVKCK